MPNVITDEKQIDELLERGVENIYPSKKMLKKKIMSGDRISLYCGFDPSAPALHIGNAIQLNKLSQFQALGHDVIFLIGDFTGMIGDPTDKEATRKKMTREEVLENAKNFQKQAKAYLDFEGENPARVLYNSEWSDKMSFKDLIEIASNFTVQQMINRDMFKRNLAVIKCEHCGFEWKSPMQFGSIRSFKTGSLIDNKTNCPKCGEITGMNKENISVKKIDQIRETPIGFHELLYPIAQGYDSVAMDVDLEVGGNDQMFNMMAGRDLMKAMKNKEKFVMTNKLIADEQGKKMGKSEGNAVFLDVDPKNMYGVIMSWPDGVIGIGFELCTKIPFGEVKKIKEELKDEKNNPRDYKMRLAFEITKIVHGEEEAKKAQENFVKTVQNKEVPYETKEVKISAGARIKAVMVENDLAESGSDAKRKIQQGGVKISDETVEDINLKISGEQDGKVLKVGKREFRKIKVV